MKILVGRRALLMGLDWLEYRDDYRKYTGDYDYFVFGESSSEGDVTVFEDDSVLLAMSKQSQLKGVASLGDLLAIKMAHLEYDIFWWKHVMDVLVLRSKGVVRNEKLYRLLKAHWKTYHGNKEHLSLYRTKDAFFDDFVSKPYEHDYLHELIALPNVPVYSLCLKDGHEVYVDKEKFDELSHEQQIRMFKEEIAVIALERWVIPSEGKVAIPHAWTKSLRKTVTALTKGWASEFIIENLEEMLSPLKNDMVRTLSIIKEN